jgi:hypothetical protein
MTRTNPTKAERAAIAHIALSRPWASDDELYDEFERALVRAKAKLPAEVMAQHHMKVRKAAIELLPRLVSE